MKDATPKLTSIYQLEQGRSYQIEWEKDGLSGVYTCASIDSESICFHQDFLTADIGIAGFDRAICLGTAQITVYPEMSEKARRDIDEANKYLNTRFETDRHYTLINRGLQGVPMILTFYKSDILPRDGLVYMIAYDTAFLYPATKLARDIMRAKIHPIPMHSPLGS